MSAKPTVPTDLSAEQLRDQRMRSRADCMAGALGEYATYTQRAIIASVRHGDEQSARGFRADAKAALHSHPELLALVEG